MGWCMYELLYAGVVSTTTMVFLVCIAYVLITRQSNKLIKIIALHGISMLVIGLGYLFSEWYMDNVSTSIHSCSDRESVTTRAMLVSVAVIILACLLLRKNKYVINKLITTVLCSINTLVVFIFLMSEVVPNWKSYADVTSFAVEFPFLVLYSLIGHLF